MYLNLTVSESTINFQRWEVVLVQVAKLHLVQIWSVMLTPDTIPLFLTMTQWTVMAMGLTLQALWRHQTTHMSLEWPQR
jgi:hypothetical protein